VVALQNEISKVLDETGWVPENASERIRFAIATGHYRTAVPAGTATLELIAALAGREAERGEVKTEAMRGQADLLETLGDVGDARAIPPLMGYLTKTPQLSGIIIKALEQIMRREPTTISNADLDALARLSTIGYA